MDDAYEYIPPNHKRCTKCKEVKRTREFYRSRQARDGRRTRCISCESRATWEKHLAKRIEEGPARGKFKPKSIDELEELIELHFGKVAAFDAWRLEKLPDERKTTITIPHSLEPITVK